MDFVHSDLTKLRQDVKDLGATAVIATHNHPDRESANFSQLDIEGCNKLKSVLEESGVDLLDFTIVVHGFLEDEEGTYFSFRENRML